MITSSIFIVQAVIFIVVNAKDSSLKHGISNSIALAGNTH